MKISIILSPLVFCHDNHGPSFRRGNRPDVHNVPQNYKGSTLTFLRRLYESKDKDRDGKITKEDLVPQKPSNLKMEDLLDDMIQSRSMGRGGVRSDTKARKSEPESRFRSFGPGSPSYANSYEIAKQMLFDQIGRNNIPPGFPMAKHQFHKPTKKPLTQPARGNPMIGLRSGVRPRTEEFEEGEFTSTQELTTTAATSTTISTTYSTQKAITIQEDIIDLERADYDHDGEVSFDEFANDAMNSEELKLAIAFSQKDENQDGKLDLEEMAPPGMLDILVVSKSQRALVSRMVMSKIDVNGDGYVDFDEYMRLIGQQGNVDLDLFGR